MNHPTLSRRVTDELATRDNQARYAAFFLLAGTQRYELAELLLHALNRLLRLGAEAKALLARLYEVERIGQTLLQVAGTHARPAVSEGFRRQGLRRIGASEIPLTQVTDRAVIAVIDIELAGELGSSFLHTHAIP